MDRWLAQIYQGPLPGKTEQEIWAELRFEYARAGGEWIEARLLAARTQRLCRDYLACRLASAS